LTTDIERFRQESVETKQRLERLPELEKRNAELFREKASLLEQIGEITIERNQVQESCVKVNKELATLTDKLEKVQQDSDTLKVEKSNLLLQYADLQKENYRSIQAIQKTTKLEIDNADLRATVDELKATQNTPAVGEVRSTNKEKAMLDENMTALQEQNVKLQGALDEWMSLAKVHAHEQLVLNA
jgi:predicted nuclease with TOPRIM domain